jgi:UrcA family protein
MTSSNTSSRYKLAWLAALVTAVAGGNAFAGSAGDLPAVNSYSSETRSIRVRYDDLDLSTQQGSNALYERISVAARKVCAPDDIRDLNAMSLSSKCTAAAIDKAVNDVHSPQLAMVHASRTRHG